MSSDGQDGRTASPLTKAGDGEKQEQFSDAQSGTSGHSNTKFAATLNLETTQKVPQALVTGTEAKGCT